MNITQNIHGAERPTFTIGATDHGEGNTRWITLTITGGGGRDDGSFRLALFTEEDPGKVLHRLAKACVAAADDLELDPEPQRILKGSATTKADPVII